MSASEIAAAGWDEPALPPEPARGYWADGWRKLRRDRSAMTALAVLVLIAVACLLAPLYASRVSGVDAFASNLDGTITINGQDQPVMAPSTEGLGLGTTPIGPTWHWGPFLLGADTQGRDVAARLLYGGRNSLLISFSATLICLVVAAVTGVVSGFFGGIVDRLISWLLDVLWAFPVYLLAISLSIVLISQGIQIGPINISSGSLSLPTLIIGIIYVPYVARPVRGQVLALRNSEFVLAAIGLGIPDWRILWRDILPNVLTTLIVFAPLMLALDMVAEAALSFLSIGVQPPDASWGTVIQDGETLLYTRPVVAAAPGIAIVITVLALNVLGDGVRDALDPRAKIKVR